MTEKRKNTANSKPRVSRSGDSGYIHVPDVGVYSFHIGASTSDSWTDVLSATTTVSWEADPEYVAGKKIVSYGTDNNLPVEIRQIMDENNLAPGILEREVGLLWGQGPQLYREKIENGDYKREWVEDKEIMGWLKNWNFEKYLQKVIVEYKFLKAHFTKYYRNRGPRIGKDGKISYLECVPAVDARLAWTESRKLEDIKYIYTGDFENSCSKGISTYPIFNINNPLRHAVSMSYSNMYSFARNFYPVPGYYGTLNWIKRSSDIPQILKSLTDNSLNIKWHIISPQAYWDSKREKLEKQCEFEGTEYKDSMLDELKDTVFGKIGDVLAGKTNVGKYFTSVSFRDEEGEMQKWEIIPIDQKVKDFIEAQVKISEKADSATTSGIGLHPSLSNIMVDGKLSSGSEMLYALKLYLASDTTLPESIIMESINHAININFPGKDLKLGFFHKIVLREEDISPSDRVTKNV